MIVNKYKIVLVTPKLLNKQHHHPQVAPETYLKAA